MWSPARASRDLVPTLHRVHRITDSIKVRAVKEVKEPTMSAGENKMTGRLRGNTAGEGYPGNVNNK